MKKQKRNILLTILIILLCVLGVGLGVWKSNTFYLKLNLEGEATLLEYGVTDLPEVSGICYGTIINKKGSDAVLTSVGTVDLTKLGNYEIEYTASYMNQTLSAKHTFIVQDTVAPVIELVADPDYFTSPVEEYKEEGFTASDNYDGDLTDQVIRVEQDGIVTYTVTDSFGNETSVKRTIVYKDVVAPVIELNDGDEISWSVGSEFVDPGFTAIDDVDGDISANVVIEGEVDIDEMGEYVLTYLVSDSSDNQFEITRTVNVQDLTKPKLKLKGDQTIYLTLNSKYEEPGYTASDNIDGKLTSEVKVKGKVNTSELGKYTKTYTVTDAAGNTAKKTRTIYVLKEQSTINTEDPGDKVVYLTFDDGPSQYTEELLDILDKFGVKATFFVTNQYSAYQDMIKETAERGHTIALHTYKHDYSTLYKSLDAYYKDLAKIQKIVKKQTGKEAAIVRFPGGTSNTISSRYCRGIMSEIVETLPLYGYQYCDWNVDSCDAGGARTSASVYNNVINGIRSYNISIVLQHDTTSYSVGAVEDIIAWGLANGYTFLPLTESSPMVHHSVNN